MIPNPDRIRPRDYAWIAPAVFLSGCAGLIHETFWIRQLSEVFGHITLAAAIAAAFMLGPAFGGPGRRLRGLRSKVPAARDGALLAAGLEKASGR